MKGEQSDAQRLVLTVLLALWVMVWLYSFSVLATAMAVATGAGFLPKFDRLGGFLGWQGIAALLALATWGVGRRWPRRSGVRRISGVPLVLALGLAGVLGSWVAWTGG